MAKEKKKIPPIRSATPRIELDLQKYEALLDDENLSEVEKRELVQTLWNVIVEFVSLGFGVHPLQQATPACGQVQNHAPKRPMEPTSEIYLDHTLVGEDFWKAASADKGSTV